MLRRLCNNMTGAALDGSAVIPPKGLLNGKQKGPAQLAVAAEMLRRLCNNILLPFVIHQGTNFNFSCLPAFAVDLSGLTGDLRG
ncbi:hypothetical protein M513_09482 [Trichuris suis]|uniref:Uncharacterized protein n=1 Tax=Trichuris suis TaxID=68888 RepID=A0A085LXF4_9BILA|nr:hypothetical protein M513_09482 [Trichuris suis]